MGAPQNKDLTRSHGNPFGSYGVVYANAVATPEMEKETPQFPPGSMIVREKFPTEKLETPEAVIAMVKREPGFSKETGGWEFFAFDGSTMALKQRETKGSCAECHQRKASSDWAFRDYLKKN